VRRWEGEMCIRSMESTRQGGRLIPADSKRLLRACIMLTCWASSF
jgi:hypothetical protein